MKIDMHCHVREGSVDSRVSLDEYITTLKEKGFDGMLITVMTLIMAIVTGNIT